MSYKRNRRQMLHLPARENCNIVMPFDAAQGRRCDLSFRANHLGWDGEFSPRLSAQRSIKIEGGTDQGQVGEGLGEIAKGFSAVTRFFRVQPQVVRIPLHLFKD